VKSDFIYAGNEESVPGEVMQEDVDAITDLDPLDDITG